MIFADIHSPQTVANLKLNSSIEINVVDPFVRKGYRFKGIAEVFDSGPEFNEFVAFFERRGTKDALHRIHSVVLVKVERALPLVSPAYDDDVSEAKVRAQWVGYYQGLHSKS